MKAIDFENYTDKQLISIRKNLIDGFDNESKLNDLPEKIKSFVLTNNPQVGNVFTRINRCITCIDKEGVKRFFKR